MSASGLPAQGTSLPSNFEVYEPFRTDPSAMTPSLESVIPAGDAVNVRVWLFGPGPGVTCDFAGLSFQAPIQLSAARADDAARNMTENRNPAIRRLRMQKLLRTNFGAIASRS